MEERYIACMICHAMGDTIGYKNSDWEFPNEQTVRGRIEKKLYEFIYLGGINYVPGKGWRISDDTILHMKTAKALLEEFKSLNSFGNILVKHYLDALKQFDKEGHEYRMPGLTTIRNLVKLSKGDKWNKLSYNFHEGGSGASMRSSCIGLAYHGKKRREKLIQMAIESSRVTHNSAIGYLGGVVAALFTAYAIENIDIKKWPHMLMDLFKHGTIGNIIKKLNRDITEYEKDRHVFIDKWHRYILDKFDDEGNVISRRLSKNLIWRSQYYMDNYGYIGYVPYKKKPVANIFSGSGGDDSVIIAYDCLLDSEKSWEKLVIYSMLHSGDTDTTGCIAASWYGAIYGFGELPLHLLKNLEYKKELENIGKQLYKKYY
uniref:ADP-ribosylglycohydrolase n=1 Tax=Mimivirus LCMiAC02 TaxID=2506609 RepID=A0A481Z2K1_9VIRU|nr:MAG: ADP-ribosylglycohydrolase [Mimivirus LCMiAC02]